jgi:hypothetical protein
MNAMSVAVTKKAAEVLKQILVLEIPDDEPETIARLMENQDGNLVCAFDQLREDDHVIEYEGQTILAIHPQIVMKFSGFILGISDEGNFTLYKPQSLN